MTRNQRILLISILLLAAALRFYRLDAQSLWNDEGNSVRLAQRSLALVTAGAAADIHPPGYYYLLWAWIRLFGDGEFAVRSLSAALGTLLVAVTYALGRRLDRPALGLAAAFLAAISPFQILYSQEARMYLLVTLIGAASTHSFLRLVQPPNQSQPSNLLTFQPSNLIPYTLLTAAGLYTHYSYPVVIAAQGAVYALWLLNTRRQGRAVARLLRWLAALAGALLLYAPWLPVAWPKLTGYGPISEAHSPAFILIQALRHYTLGPTAGDAPWTTWALIGFTLLLLLGMARWFSIPRSPFAIRLLPPLYAAAPVALMLALSLTRPAYRPKFFLVGTPGFHLLLAAAILPPAMQIRRFADSRTHQLANPYTAAVLLFVALTVLPGLHNYYHDPAYARDDYRGMARYIEAAARPGDAIIFNAPNQWEVFTYYYGGDAPTYPLPHSRPLDRAATAAELAQIVGEHRRIFALYWGVAESDPERFVESWLEGHTYRATDSWHGDVRLAVYSVPRMTDSETPQHPLNLTLGDAVALHGYSLAAETVEAGDVLQLTLFWQARRQPTERYKVFVQLLDAANHIVGQLDSEPGGNLLPTDTWQPGQEVIDRYGVLVQPGTPPGPHRLVAGMYSLTTGARLPVQEGDQVTGDHVTLAQVTVRRPSAPPPVATLPMQHRADWSGGGLALLGYDLHKLGHAHQPNAPLRPGDPLHVNLYWQAQGPIATDRRLQLRLLDDDDRTWAELEAPLAGVDYDPAQWAAGEIVRAQFNIFVPADVPPGRYRLQATPVSERGESSPPWDSPSLPIGQ
jgi:4-amino-4-deoxy-L-arabinose transferase-like glycosyltransferase